MGRRRSSGGSQIEGVVSSIMEAESSGLELSADMANINVEWMKERKKEQGLVYTFDHPEEIETLIQEQMKDIVEKEEKNQDALNSERINNVLEAMKHTTIDLFNTDSKK